MAKTGAAVEVRVSRCKAEFLVEPFEEGSPGPHVTAAIDAVVRSGLEPDVGPFGTVVEGDHEAVVDALRTMLGAAMENGASRVSVHMNVVR